MAVAREALAVIERRHSTRSFTQRQLMDEQVRIILEAGSAAPYAWEPPLHFAIIQDKTLLERVNRIAKETAKQLEIAPVLELASDPQYHALYHAPILIIISGSNEAPIPLEADCAAATQNLLLAAEALALGSCWVHFPLFAFLSEQAPALRHDLGIPEDYKPYYAAVFGYKAEVAVAGRERRKNLSSYRR